MTYEEMHKVHNQFGSRYWELRLDGTQRSETEIETILASEGCPTATEVENAYIAETGMSFDVAAELIRVQREWHAAIRYWGRD